MRHSLQIYACSVEINATLNEIKQAYDSVAKWAKPESPAFSINFAAMKPVIRKEPKGTVLIISPFNYPLWLSFGPVAGAIAAGCTVVLKPSEISTAVSALMSEIIPQYMDNDVFRVVNGAVPESTKLLELQWDHSSYFPLPFLLQRQRPILCALVLYTGGNAVAKVVSAAAAKHLTPVSLELGGKSPVIIDSSCDLTMTAKRLLWGKTVNAGQTCVAPDYVLVPRGFQDTLVDALKKTYVPPRTSPMLSKDCSDSGGGADMINSTLKAQPPPTHSRASSPQDISTVSKIS